MVLRHRVALDGVQLDSVDDRIMISRVETGDGKENISTVSLWGDGTGSRVTAMHRDSIDITVKFRIRVKKRDMSDREEVLEKVNAWAAAGGVLTTNIKPGRKITVFRAQAAGAGDPWEWTKEYSIIFRACGIPYWQEDTPATKSVTSTDGTSASLTVGGSEKTVMDVSFKNTSGESCGTFSIGNGENTLSFTDLGLASGETLVIDHKDTGKLCVLRIRIKSALGVWRSAMDKHSPTSDNDLLTTPGTKTVTMSAAKTGDFTVSASGRFA